MNHRERLNMPLPQNSGQIDWPWTASGISSKLQEEVKSIYDGCALPRITVIMPSYNQAEYIEESIRSVLMQEYPNLEFFIFDGNSKDNTVDIIKKYEHLITYWESCPDRGQSHAINKGFARATGEYVGWLNSDDLYYPNALHKIARAIKDNPDAGLIYGKGSKINSQSHIITEIPFRSFDKKRLSTRFYLLQQSSFIKKSRLERKDMVIEDLFYTMDWELSIWMSRKGPVAAIDEEIGMFRIHDICKTSTGSLVRRREIARVGKMCNGFFDRNFLLFKIFYPIFKYDMCSRKDIGFLRKHLCHWWRRAIALVYKPESHMMH